MTMWTQRRKRARRATTDLAAYSPAPTAGTLFGVDRATDETRLAGIRFDASAPTIEHAIRDLDRELDVTPKPSPPIVVSAAQYAEIVRLARLLGWTVGT